MVPKCLWMPLSPFFFFFGEECNKQLLSYYEFVYIRMISAQFTHFLTVKLPLREIRYLGSGILTQAFYVTP